MSVNSKIILLAIAFVLLSFWSSNYVQSLNSISETSSKSRARKKIEVNVRSTLECHRREYTYKAINKDQLTEHQCWDYVTVESCWGRCDSGEIADYHFPFKKSYHYVCIHGNTEIVQFKLEQCTSGAPETLQKYETIAAKTCVCALCETSSANCESYPAK